MKSQIKSLYKKAALPLAVTFLAVSLTGCSFIQGIFGGKDDTPASDDLDPAVSLQISQLQSQVEELRAQTITEIPFANKGDYIEGNEVSPKVSEAREERNKNESAMPDSIFIKGVEYSTDRKILQLSDRGLTNKDIEELKYMVELEELQIYQNNISDLSALKGLTNLKTLSLYYNNVSDLSPLGGLVNLEQLFLRANNISDISALDELVNLTTLDISENDIMDIRPLRNMTKMELLRINDNKISDISVLGKMTNIGRVHMQNNRIVDISAVQTWVSVTEIYLDGNFVTNIEPMRGLTTLKWLKLGGNPVADISPVFTMTELKKIYVEGISLDDDDMAGFAKSLPRCEIVQ